MDIRAKGKHTEACHATFLTDIHEIKCTFEF